MNERINTLIESEYQSQIQEKQARLEALQAQLDPHFLYNTLQTISGIAIENNVLEIEEINNSLSEILRYSLNNSKQLVKIDEEVKIVQDYMNIQKHRFGDRVNLEIDLSKEALELRVPVFFLQLPVENAIKHGMEKSVHTVNIHVYDTRIRHIFISMWKMMDMELPMNVWKRSERCFGEKAGRNLMNINQKAWLI